VRAEGPALPLETASVDALVVTEAWPSPADEWLRVLSDGGRLVSVIDEERSEATRRALCAGLVDLRQRPAGRIHVTCGRWRRLAEA
jgi:protein-L-isoaspartate O-methyltransferase